MKKPKPSKAAIDFFVKNAGSSYDPKKETAAQGKLRGAKRLAQAEIMAEDLGWKFEWEGDPDAAMMYREMDEEDREATEDILVLLLRDENGKIVGSLGGIGFGRNSVDNKKQGRVFEAEVALEALSEKGLL